MLGGYFVGWQLFQIRFTKRREHVLVAFFRNYSLKRRFGLDRGQINCWPIFFLFCDILIFFFNFMVPFLFQKMSVMFSSPDRSHENIQRNDRPFNQSITPSFHPSNKEHISSTCPIHQPSGRPIHPAVNRSISQSTNPSTNHAFNNHPITTSILRPRGVQQRFGEVGMIQRRTQKINRQRFHGFLRSENECKIARVEDTEKTL